MSQGMIGADIEGLRRLAQQFDSAGNRLNALAGSVGNGIRTSAWAGPFAINFRATWDSKHSAALRHAASELHRYATLLRSEAAQQDTASNASSGTAIPGASLSAGGAESGGVHLALGGIDVNWNQLNPEPAFHSLMGVLNEQIPGLAGLSPWAGVGAALNVATLVGREVPLVGGLMQAADVLHGVDLIAQGDPSGWFTLSHSAAGVMAESHHPVAMLGSLAIHAWTMAAEEATQVDWSESATQDTFAYAASHPEVIVEELGAATLEVGVQLVGWLPIHGVKK